jgi:hypothetical protein
MITCVLVIAQGPNDIGFLMGLRDRLGCGAELINYQADPRLRQRSSLLKRGQAKLICEVSLNQYPVDLIVRLTDGDTRRCHEVRNKTVEAFPENVRAMLVCGVCDRDVEHWLSLDPHYLARELEFDPSELPAARLERSSFVKSKVSQRAKATRTSFVDVVAELVREAPLHSWLANPAFADFYDQCRDAAQRRGCEVTNLRDREQN